MYSQSQSQKLGLISPPYKGVFCCANSRLWVDIAHSTVVIFRRETGFLVFVEIISIYRTTRTFQKINGEVVFTFWIIIRKKELPFEGTAP